MGWSARQVCLSLLVGAVVIFLLLFGSVPPASAVIRGACVDCHAMHNSQGGTAMTYDGEGQPQPMLLRGSCIGCHAQGGSSKIIFLNGNQFPQVMHNDASGDLAGGNFAYIKGGKGSGALDSKGHNVIDLLERDSRLDYAPGSLDLGHQGVLVSSALTCAGSIGCHGTRQNEIPNDQGGSGTGLKAIKGAHHGNVDGLINQTPTTVGGSYRFLYGVMGLENPDPDGRWQNKNGSSHNEYYGVDNSGASLPSTWDGSCGMCHQGTWDSDDYTIRPANRSISGFCATCHPNFHGLVTVLHTPDVTSPFLRHPTDIVIKNEGEYAQYTNYDITAPVGRQVLPAAPSSEVRPGSDTVTCLSCHMAHASDYPGMLRFDYGQIVAGDGGAASDTGCFACHSSKD